MKKSTKIIVIALAVLLIAAVAIYFITRQAPTKEEVAQIIDMPDSFDAKISIDKDTLGAMMGGSPQMTEQVGMISSLLDAITIKGTSYKGSAELNLVAGNDSFLTIGAKNAEEGLTIASSLLGDSVIYASQEDLKKLMEQSTAGTAATAADAASVDFKELSEAIKGLDQKQVEKDCNEVGESLKKAIEEKKGEKETGEFTVDGFTFTSKTPVNMTFEELMELEINSVKELLGKESLKPVVDILSKSTDITAELDKALEELKNQPADQKYNMDLAIYEGEKDSKYFAASLTRESAKETVNFGFGTVDGLERGIAHAETEQMTMDIASSGTKDGAFDIKANVLSGSDKADITGTGDAKGNIDILCDIQSASMPAKIHVTTADGEANRKNFNLDVFFMGGEKPLLNISGTAGKGGEIVSVFEGEKIEVIPITKLMEGDQATMTTLSMTAVTNLMKGVNTLTKNLPSETATWVSSLFSGLMGGATKQ